MGMTPDTVNAQGSVLTRSDRNILYGEQEAYGGYLHGMDPTKRAQFLLNWLTAGGPPKPLDPGQTFADAQAAAPMEAIAAKGRGFGGLFGTGSMIGDIAPIQPLKPLNLSPLQPGVPYSVPALPKVGG